MADSGLAVSKESPLPPMISPLQCSFSFFFLILVRCFLHSSSQKSHVLPPPSYMLCSADSFALSPVVQNHFLPPLEDGSCNRTTEKQ